MIRLGQGRLCLFVRSDVDELTSTLTFAEHYDTVNQSVDGVVLTHAHVESGVVYSTALTLDDVARLSVLSAKNLNSESFAF